MQVLIEAKKGSTTRVRFDETTLGETGRRSLRAAYPWAYGFVVGSGSPTEDCLDCFILGKRSFEYGQIVECVPLEVFILSEGEEQDIKLIASTPEDGPAGNLERYHAEIRDFLIEVFKAWPEITVAVGPLPGKARALEYLQAREQQKAES